MTAEAEDYEVEWTEEDAPCEVCGAFVALTTEDKPDDRTICIECDDLSGWREGQPEFNGAFA